MADVARPAACEACGRQLPPQLGRGRVRRYCNATCRSAARRTRELNRGRSQGVKAELTTNVRHDNLDAVVDGPVVGGGPAVGGEPGTGREPGVAGQPGPHPEPGVAGRTGPAPEPAPVDQLASRVRDAAGRLAGELARGGAGSSLTAMAAARELSAATGAALQEAVDRARATGHSWREIGDVLGTTRQAAFQRFGHPVDPRTGAPVSQDVPPGAVDRAVATVSALTEGRWDGVSRDFSSTMRERSDPGRLASGWAHTVGLIGRYEGMGEPFAHRAGDNTVVEIPLHFEAGEAVGRVIFDEAGEVAGLWLRPASPP